jgi:hypothetical protein
LPATPYMLLLCTVAPKAGEKAPAKKAAPAKTGDAGKKKKKVAKVESYKLYIYKVSELITTTKTTYRCPVPNSGHYEWPS